MLRAVQKQLQLEMKHEMTTGNIQVFVGIAVRGPVYTIQIGFSGRLCQRYQGIMSVAIQASTVTNLNNGIRFHIGPPAFSRKVNHVEPENPKTQKPTRIITKTFLNFARGILSLILQAMSDTMSMLVSMVFDI